MIILTWHVFIIAHGPLGGLSFELARLFLRHLVATMGSCISACRQKENPANASSSSANALPTMTPPRSQDGNAVAESESVVAPQQNCVQRCVPQQRSPPTSLPNNYRIHHRSRHRSAEQNIDQLVLDSLHLIRTLVDK